MHQLGEAISELLQQYSLTEKLNIQRAITSWEQIVGPAMSNNCRAVELRGHTLVVRAKNAAWRNEIAMQKDEILRKLNLLLGSEKIRNIRFSS